MLTLPSLCTALGHEAGQSISPSNGVWLARFWFAHRALCVALPGLILGRQQMPCLCRLSALLLPPFHLRGCGTTSASCSLALAQVAAVHGQVFEEKGSQCAIMMETKRPEIRTAMLKDHKPIELVEGQELTLVAVGEDYAQWEGYKDLETGETKIGLSYRNLCSSVSAGSRILISNGALAIEVVEVINGEEVRGKVLNTKKLGERSIATIPGAELDLTAVDEDCKKELEFARHEDVDYVAASFMQSADDVEAVRGRLARGMGKTIKVIAKIESAAGVRNFDEILRAADGVMVARARLGLEIPAEKVAMVQKVITTKAVIAGKMVVVASDMLSSMVSSVLPTRAEMTDAANAALDGVDAVLLAEETSNGLYPFKATSTMAAILKYAEEGVNSAQVSGNPKQPGHAKVVVPCLVYRCPATVSGMGVSGEIFIACFRGRFTTSSETFLPDQQAPSRRLPLPLQRTASTWPSAWWLSSQRMAPPQKWLQSTARGRRCWWSVNPRAY